ncbi:MAG: class I SAM-dependent methyltransferase [Ignavibacterium sp.]|jgi:ubiquinone/menaquinone biosynthesis C-methylase UbiE|nr:class I SAM-dependent methyltransferase [Ignavibacterium sp.]
MSKFYQILLLPYLYIRCNFFWWKADKTNLPGERFFKFGKSIGLQLLQKFILSPKLLLNPVSIVRYFEYDFALRNFSTENSTRNNILDISSPYLFGFYLASFSEGAYNYINPDNNDLTLVKKYSSKLKFRMKYNAESADATKLTFSDNSFTHIISISVIEHIIGYGDSEAIREMWRVLKPNGLLILTFPVAKVFEDEFSDRDTYGLNVNQINEKYFFQRVYDEKSITEKLLNNIQDFTILEQQIFGEREHGFYSKYSERWKKKGLSETVKDPYYISEYFKKLDSFDQIKDSAVMGITLRKDK